MEDSSHQQGNHKTQHCPRNDVIESPDERAECSTQVQVSR